MTFSGLYGDPDALQRRAAALGRDADLLREEAAALRRRSGATAWQGRAAAAARTGLDGDARRLEAVAAVLDAAAAELRAHAREVAHTLARIRAAEVAVRAWFSEQERLVAALAGGVRDALTSPLDSLGDALDRVPWRSWPWRPDRLPSPGSLEWLDVGDLVRRHRGPP